MYPILVTLKHHRFDLTAMSVGDWFLGCNRCGFQLDNFTAARPICPECGSALKLLEVTEADVTTGEAP
jgi:rRNA maturation endonuclease Nob1